MPRPPMYQENVAFPYAKRDYWIAYGVSLGVLFVLAVVGFISGQKQQNQHPKTQQRKEKGDEFGKGGQESHA